MKLPARSVLLVLQLTLFVSTASAWQSALFSTTHKQIADKAISLLPKDSEGKDLYPDIVKYANALREGSHAESHNTYLEKYSNSDILNGGVPFWWWNDALENRYMRWQTEAAYFNVGRTCHLIQDQAVPAHAANIRH